MIHILKYIPTTRSTLSFIIGGVLILLLLMQCNKNETLKREISNNNIISTRNINNINASKDTIRFERNKNGVLVAKKLSYEYDIRTLTETNKKVIKDYVNSLNLNTNLKGINSLLSAELRIKDSIINSGGIVVNHTDSTATLTFNDEKKWDRYNWRKFNGTVDILRNTNNNEIRIVKSKFNFEQGIQLKAAIVDDDGFKKLKITTPYPGVEFTNIENINLVNDKLNQAYKKKAGWSLGMGIGYGINLNNQQIISVGPSINIGLIWSPKWLRF